MELWDSRDFSPQVSPVKQVKPRSEHVTHAVTLPVPRSQGGRDCSRRFI